MRNVKYRFNYFLPYDRAGMERYLEKQAAKGWMVEGLSSTGKRWLFRYTEPQTLRFAASFPPPSIGKEEEYSANKHRFQELYEHSGWKSVFSTDYLHIFCCNNSNSTSPETDATVELSALHRWVKKNFLTAQVVGTTIFFALFVFILWQFIASPTVFLVSPGKIAGGIACLLSLLTALCEIGKYYHWHHRAVRCVQCGNELPPVRGNIIFSSLCYAASYLLLIIGRLWRYGALYIVGLLLLFALAYALRFLLIVCKLDEGTATATTFIIMLLLVFFGVGLFLVR
ncbi:MAG: DUF2812 domain-containing protein [Clostridia bacterium]|nr:DUF2812 domain-containing protein [Clostridia bacterium]